MTISGIGDAAKFGAGRAAAVPARQVAREFEAVLLELMLKQMRRAGAAWNEQGKAGASRIYFDWFDREVAVSVAGSGGAGLSRALEQQLIRRYGT